MMQFDAGLILNIIGVGIGLGLALLAWIANRLVNALDALAGDVRRLETRMALIEFRLSGAPANREGEQHETR